MPRNYPGEGYPDEGFNWAKYGPIISCAFAFTAIIIAVVVAGMIVHTDAGVNSSTAVQNEALAKVEADLASVEEKLNAQNERIATLEAGREEIFDTVIKGLGYNSFNECLTDMKSRIIDLEKGAAQNNQSDVGGNNQSGTSSSDP